MTIWDLLAACGRRWLVLLLGLGLTICSIVAVGLSPGVYWAQGDMVFLPPTSNRFPNTLSNGSESLIMAAGLVERDLDEASQLSGTSSANVTLVDIGVTDGELVRLPNLGGQWANNFSQPLLDVQVVGSTPEEVEQRFLALRKAIIDDLDRRQDEAGVDAYNRISIQSTPAMVEVEYRHGNDTRAAIVLLVLGVGLTLTAVVFFDRKRQDSRAKYLEPLVVGSRGI